MGDKNPISTLGDYSKPSHEGYRNTTELPVGNNVVPLRSDTIRLVQNRCSFHIIQSEDPNQHLKDFLKLMDLLDLDCANRERMRLCLFQFSLLDQASNWLDRLPAGSIATWEDLTTLNPVKRRTIDQSAGGKLRDLNAEESWALLEDLTLYDNESWNDPRDFAKPVKEITLPQDIPRGPTAQINFTSTNYHTTEELQSKGIKSPSKLVSPKYLSQSSLIEQNINPSSPKRVHFVNSIVILNKEGEAKEESSMEAYKAEFTDHEMSEETEEVKSEEEVDEETEDEAEEEEKEGNPKHFNIFPTMNELKYHEWLLKNYRPPWVKAKIRSGNVNNVKFLLALKYVG
ncbi:hypothetical protein Tco_1338115 [Tanacetum coccineum]